MLYYNIYFACFFLIFSSSNSFATKCAVGNAHAKNIVCSIIMLYITVISFFSSLHFIKQIIIVQVVVIVVVIIIIVVVWVVERR
jgi:predicted glycosyltransferase involved in capsule biosynthesis